MKSISYHKVSILDKHTFSLKDLKFSSVSSKSIIGFWGLLDCEELASHLEPIQTLQMESKFESKTVNLDYSFAQNIKFEIFNSKFN